MGKAFLVTVLYVVIMIAQFPPFVKGETVKKAKADS
jgi:hypothetical protein